MKPSKTYAVLALFAIGAVAAAVLFRRPAAEDRSGRYDGFVRCLSERGAIFYGAYWCPHCQDQKELFDSSAEHLPYVECAVRGSREQEKVCADAGVKAYPTWQFADGETKTGTLSLEELGAKTGCALP